MRPRGGADGAVAADAKRVMSVWAKRLASTASPSACHKCTCTVADDTLGWLDCRRCHAVATPTVDMSFLVDEKELAVHGVAKLAGRVAKAVDDDDDDDFDSETA